MTSAAVCMRKNASHFADYLGWDAKAFLRERMDRDEKSASRILLPARVSVLGWLLALGGLGLFGVIAGFMNDDCALTQFDARLATTLHEHAQANPKNVAILKSITAFGSAWVLTSLAFAVALALSWRGHHVLSRVWGIVFAGCLLNDALKHLYHRHRPHFLRPVVLEASWSFPSGHAMGALIGYGLLAYLLWLVVPHRRLRMVAVAGTGLLILVIGFSRLYLGAHYFSDVIAGYAAGTAWLAVSISGIELFQRSGHLRLFSNRSPTPPTQYR